MMDIFARFANWPVTTILSPDQLSQQQVGDYLLHLINDCDYAPGTLKVSYNGIKFFYSVTCPRDWDVLRKLRIPKQKTLPDVLTIDEVHRNHRRHTATSQRRLLLDGLLRLDYGWKKGLTCKSATSIPGG